MIISLKTLNVDWYLITGNFFEITCHFVIIRLVDKSITCRRGQHWDIIVLLYEFTIRTLINNRQVKIGYRIWNLGSQHRQCYAHQEQQAGTEGTVVVRLGITLCMCMHGFG